MRVPFVCGEKESVSEVLQRLDAALRKAITENTVVGEVLAEIRRRRFR